MKMVKIIGALLCIGGFVGTCGMVGTGNGESGVPFLAVAAVGFVMFVVGRFGD